MKFTHFQILDSTNAEALRRVEDGTAEPVWISADQQSLGKGRRGRDWVSGQGNLYCTGLYPHPGDLGSAAKLSFVAALAVADSLGIYINPDLISIKWPNDVLVDGKKIAGILLESASVHGQLWIAVGIGINLLNHPDISQTPATHLLEHIPTDQLESAEPVFTGAAPVLAHLAARFDGWRQLYLDEGFAPIQIAWTERAIGLGKPVTARLTERTLSGIAIGLDRDGALLLELENGAIEKIHAGDVFFPETDL